MHVIHKIERVDRELLAELRRISAATVHEAFGGQGALPSTIKPLTREMSLCGPAVTVKVRPGENLIIHKAIYVAQRGDVLVVDTGGYAEAGIWGNIMTVAAHERGLEGLVTNGCVRDSEEIIATGFPVFAQGLSIRGTTKNCLGWINHPMCMGEVIIEPGDVVLGDADGVVVVARDAVAEVIAKSRARDDKEKKFIEEMKAGRSTLELYHFADTLRNLGLREESPER